MSVKQISQKHSLQFRESYFSHLQIPQHLLLTEKPEIYKCLHWQCSHFVKEWESNIGTYAAGTIRRYNHIFHVQFAKRCSLGKIKSLLSTGDNPQLILSFRKSPGLPAVVIVDFLFTALETSNLFSLEDSEII